MGYRGMFWYRRGVIAVLWHGNHTPQGATKGFSVAKPPSFRFLSVGKSLCPYGVAYRKALWISLTKSLRSPLCGLECGKRFSESGLGFPCTTQEASCATDALSSPDYGEIDFRFQGISLEICQKWISRALLRGMPEVRSRNLNPKT
jgi:hypothetical protein